MGRINTRVAVTPPDDPRVTELLKKYHRDGIIDRKELSKRFLNDHGILMSERTIARRKGQLGLHASRLTTLKLSEDEKRKLILDQMAKDPKGKMGPRTVKKGIFEDTGISLTRDYIIEAMRNLDPEAYDARSPAHAKEKRKKRLIMEAQQNPSRDNGSGSQESHESPSISTRDSSGQAGRPLSIEPVPRSGPGPSSTPGQTTSSIGFNHSLPLQSDSEEASAPMVLSPNSGSLQLPSIAPAPLPMPEPMMAPTLDTANAASPHFPSTTAATLSCALQVATPRIVELTQFLRGIDTTALSNVGSSEVYRDALKCMEAAALLERQLARVASALQPRT